MTIDELAVMVQKGFNELHEQLDGVTVTQAEHGERMTRIETTLDEHSRILDEHSERLESIEHKLDATIATTDRLDERVSRLEAGAGFAVHR